MKTNMTEKSCMETVPVRHENNGIPCSDFISTHVCPATAHHFFAANTASCPDAAVCRPAEKKFPETFSIMWRQSYGCPVHAKKRHLTAR